MMLASTTAPFMAAVSVVSLILVLLFGCFAVIFILAIFFKVVSGPAGRKVLMLGGALLLFAGLQLFNGVRRPGRAARPSAASWQVEGVGEAGLRHALTIRGDDASRRSVHAEVNGIEIEEGTEDAVALALLSAEVAKRSAREGGLYPGARLPVAPEAVIALAPGHARPESKSESVGKKLRSTAKQAVRRSREVARHVRSEARRSTRGLRSWARGNSAKGIAGMLLTAFALAAFLFVGYVFLDAGTRGQFTWPLRLVSLLAFVLFLVSLARWSMF